MSDINVTNDPSGAMTIEVLPGPFPWRILAAGLLVLLAGIGAIIWFATQYAAPHPGSGGGHSSGGSGGAVSGIIGAACASAMAQQRVRKITLGRDEIEIFKGTAKKPITMPVSQIKNCIVKLSGKGAWYTIEGKYGKLKIKFMAPEKVYAVLKTEIPKRYSFPMS